MANEIAEVADLIFGRWKSQICYAGVKLGIFEITNEADALSYNDIAEQLGLDPTHAYRLLRALANLELLKETANKEFTLTKKGAVLRADHPSTLRGVTLLEEGPEHYAIWKHLVAMMQDGKQNGFEREFGVDCFDYSGKHPDGYGAVFDCAMSSFSATHSQWVVEALQQCPSDQMSSIRSLIDVGGGQGHLLCNLVKEFPSIEHGVVMELASVVQNRQRPQFADEMGVSDKVSYHAGDMFEKVDVSGDAIIMKMILHDWNDEECLQILKNCLEAVPSGSGRVFCVEHIVSDHDTPSFSKLFDIHMMCVSSGRERTISEYKELLERAGWTYETTYFPASKGIGVVCGIKK